jgi:hypothetical protein
MKPALLPVLSFVALSMVWLVLFTGCAAISESSKYQFVDGIYKAKIFNNKKTEVYVGVNEDSIAVFKLANSKKPYQIDTLQSVPVSFPAIQDDSLINPNNFTQRSFDLDILTIPFKYRPSRASLPHQLNTTFNGALYMGYRRDVYRLTYQRAPIHAYKRKITHYGASLGLFSGIGNTAMNPWVTNDQITSEYDGIVWLKGIAGIIGINNVTFGLAVGVDHLLDQNRKVWIYQGKPWAGLVLGLNLN